MCAGSASFFQVAFQKNISEDPPLAAGRLPNLLISPISVILFVL